MSQDVKNRSNWVIVILNLFGFGAQMVFSALGLKFVGVLPMIVCIVLACFHLVVSYSFIRWPLT